MREVLSLWNLDSTLLAPAPADSVSSGPRNSNAPITLYFHCLFPSHHFTVGSVDQNAP